MRAEALNAASWNLGGERKTQREIPLREESLPSIAAGWNEHAFAEEQIRGLVRRVFSPTLIPRVQQVAFCPVECETDVRNLCGWVGEILAEEESADIAVLDESESCSHFDSHTEDVERQEQPPTNWATQFGRRSHKNLWSFRGRCGTPGTSERVSLSAYLADIRREFEFSIIAAPSPTISSKALQIASLADGLILVLSAQRTRRATAVRVKSALTNVRLLGAVLSEREFPIPDRIYRRL